MKHRTSIILCTATLLLSNLAGALGASPATTDFVGDRQRLEPRRVATKPLRTVIPPGYSDRALHVKFKEGSGVRLSGERLVGAQGAELTKLQGVLGSFPGAGVERLFSRPEEELLREKLSLQRRSGRELADKTLYYRIRVDESHDITTLIDDLNALDVVEIAYPEPDRKSVV